MADKNDLLYCLKKMCFNCEYGMSCIEKLCPFRSISNEHCDEYEKIKKALEDLKK